MNWDVYRVFESPLSTTTHTLLNCPDVVNFHHLLLNQRWSWTRCRKITFMSIFQCSEKRGLIDSIFHFCHWLREFWRLLPNQISELHYGHGQSFPAFLLCCQMRCAKISCKPSATEAKWKGNIPLLMQRCTAAIYALACGNNSNLINLGIIKKEHFPPLYGLLSAKEVYKKWEREMKGKRADGLTVNSFWSLHRINDVRIDGQRFCIKIRHILAQRPHGYRWDYRVGHGLGDLHYMDSSEGVFPSELWREAIEELESFPKSCSVMTKVVRIWQDSSWLLVRRRLCWLEMKRVWLPANELWYIIEAVSSIC